MKDTLEALVEKAQNGDRKALERLIIAIKDLVYNLSLRMLLYPLDAQDATQEVLVKIVTHLSTFKGNSAFKTWVYRVATNYLLLIDSGHSDTIAYTQNKGEQLLLEEEVKVSCTHGMLLCLNESNRMVYILGVILEFNSIEGSKMLDISPENFRKQLSRSDH